MLSIPIFLINLDSDTKRNNFMNYQFSFLGVADNVIRVPAVDMRKIKLNEMKQDSRISLFTKFTIQNRHRCDHKQIDSTGAIGCTLSHYKAWKTIIDQNIDMAIIMEDDMRLMLDFLNIVQSEIQKYKNQFHMINLGYQKQNYSEVNNSKLHFGTGCYIVTREACEILCKYAFPIEVHVDAYFFLLDHFGYLKMILSTENSVYYQGGVQSTIGHGMLKCNDNNENKIVVYQKSKSKSKFSNSVAIVLGFILLISIVVHLVLFHRGSSS